MTRPAPARRRCARRTTAQRAPVVDLSTWIGGAYCTKLLADGGAEVIKIEPPDGDPLRRWSASGAVISPDSDGALFNFLNASKQSVVVETENADDLAQLHALLASADGVVWSRGSPVAEHAPLAPAEILRTHPHLTVTSITSFGLEGPWSDKAATEFTLQAWSGGIVGLVRGQTRPCPSVRRWPDRRAALRLSSAPLELWLHLRRADGRGIWLTCSMLESLAMCLTYYPVTFHDQLGRPMRRRRFVPDSGRRGRERRAGRSWVRDRPTMAGLLRNGRTSRVDGGPEAVLGPNGAGSDHRCVDRRSHRGRGDQSRLGLPDPQCTDRRERLERRDV